VQLATVSAAKCLLASTSPLVPTTTNPTYTQNLDELISKYTTQSPDHSRIAVSTTTKWIELKNTLLPSLNSAVMHLLATTNQLFGQLADMYSCTNQRAGYKHPYTRDLDDGWVELNNIYVF
jgi:hypothetical protein